MATKTKEPSSLKEKKPQGNTRLVPSLLPANAKLVAASPSGKPIPNYLKPTFCSKPEIASKYVKKSSIINGEDSPVQQKDRLQRRRSFDRSPPSSVSGGTLRAKAAAGTLKPVVSKSVKSSARSTPKRTIKSGINIVNSAPESLNTSPTKCNDTPKVLEEHPVRESPDEQLAGDKGELVEKEILELPAAEQAADTEDPQAEEPTNESRQKLEESEPEMTPKEDENPTEINVKDLRHDDVTVLSPVDQEEETKHGVEATSGEDIVEEADSSVEAKQEPPEVIEKPEAAEEIAAIPVQKTEVVLGKQKNPSAYNDVIEETKNKLLEKKKNKVKALVGAFETVIDYESAAK